MTVLTRQGLNYDFLVNYVNTHTSYFSVLLKLHLFGQYNLSTYFLTFINYATVAWASKNKTHLKKILRKQKQVARIMSSNDISILSRLLTKELNILNVYQINNLQHLSCKLVVKSSIMPRGIQPSILIIRSYISNKIFW